MEGIIIHKRASNSIIAGDYKHSGIMYKWKEKLCINLDFHDRDFHFFRDFFKKRRYLSFNKETVEHFNVLEGYGNFYRIEVFFKDGKKSIIEINDIFYEFFLKEVY